MPTCLPACIRYKPLTAINPFIEFYGRLIEAYGSQDVAFRY